MPQKREYNGNAQGIGETEVVQVMLLSEAMDQFTSGDLEDAIVVLIPDTGKGRFEPSHATKPDKDGKVKQTKACFVIGELGGWQAGQGIDFRQSQGDVESLPLTVRMSVIAQVPNTKATSIDEALNRKPQLVEVPQNETKAA